MPYFKDSNNKIHFLDSEDFIHLLPSGSVKITDDEAEYRPDALMEFRQSAKSALMDTSVTMERILEAVSLGETSLDAADVVAWMNYRKQLREYIHSDTVVDLPVKPPYPSGT